MAPEYSQRTSVLVTTALLAAIWIAIVLHYVPTRYSYDWDSSQLGRGVTEYSIEKHQPHPPGYPLWVAAARAVAKTTPTIPGALSILAFLFSASALIVFWLAASEIVPGRESIWIAALLAFSPPVLFYSAAQASYSSDLFAACVAGYFALKIQNGAPRYFVYFCVFLGLAVGLRQSGAVFLSPVLALSGFTAWRRSRKVVALGLAAGAAVFTAWFVPFVRLAGGWARYCELTSRQFELTASRTSIFWGAPIAHHLRMLLDLSVWIAAAIAGLGVAIAVSRRPMSGEGPKAAMPRVRSVLLLWGGPNLLFLSLFHFPKPGYLLLSLPALFLGIGMVGLRGPGRRVQTAGMAGLAVSLAVSFFPYEQLGAGGQTNLLFQVGRYMPPALTRIDADNRLLAGALAEAAHETPIICLHWSGEAPNCRSAPWDFPIYQWVGSQGQRFAASLPMGAEALFLCDRAGPSENWRSKMRNWTQLAEGWRISVWRATK